MGKFRSNFVKRGTPPKSDVAARAKLEMMTIRSGNARRKDVPVSLAPIKFEDKENK